MNYRKLNVRLGWLIFAIATIVYFLTIESTVSLWDCGEYIMAAYKLEVGHPPGAPLFMLLGRLFTFFAQETNVAMWINRMSALSSSFTILFMFWSITMLVKKMILQRKSELSSGDIIAVMGSGAVGALAYTFSETFWFSAVEGEVYAMSSLFTALVFWAILKWDEEMALVQGGKLSLEAAPNRWLLLIFFLIGLAIGVHLLGILLVPAIVYMIFFRLWKDVKTSSFVIAGVLSLIILVVIQEGVISGTISLASSFEVFFRNAIGLPFATGTILFFSLLIGGLAWGVRYARQKQLTVLYNSLFGLIFLLIGYGSFAIIVIRSNADTPMDQNNPENLVNLYSYLKREQYGSSPLLSGPYWNSKEEGGQFNRDGNWEVVSRSNWKDRNPVYARRFIVEKNHQVLKTFLHEKDAKKYAIENKAEYKEAFHEINALYRKNAEAVYSQSTIFPRMWSGDDQRKVEGYKNWSGYDASRRDGERGKDNLPLPTFSENITYFMRYQLNWMYFRYFLWNFAGRQNDIQGDGNQMLGNWKSGFSFVDDIRLGDQTIAPYYTTNNKANNSFFFIPLVLGLIGLFFHAYRSPKDAFVVFLGYLLTGIAIIVYVNQRVYEPRERDYAYAGSYYFFAMWIGIGVYALYYAFTSFAKKHFVKFGTIAGVGLLLFLLFDIGSEHSMPNTISWITISVMALLLLGMMKLLGKFSKNESIGASVATILCMTAPVIMGVQGWDDHDRSRKTTAHDVAYNYLVQIAPNGVIFTNGDNDTFPLWYIQEVEDFRSDVRVCNLSLMQTDWYTAQMMRKTYESDPLPIHFSPDQVLTYSGGTDYIQFIDLTDLYFLNGVTVNNEQLKKIISLRLHSNEQAAVNAATNFAYSINGVISALNITQPALQNRVSQLHAVLTRPIQTDKLVDDIHARLSAMREIYSAIQNRAIAIDEQTFSRLQEALTQFGQGWETMDLKDAMNFVRDDNNMLIGRGESTRFFPTNKFRLHVNKENVLKSGVVAENTDKEKIMDVVELNFNTRTLTREEIMMLDVLANNEWKRGIYFSNARASKVSSALLDANVLKQIGSCYELNPIKRQNIPLDPDKLHESLIAIQHFGLMNDPTVLTDYYARRHVYMFRSQFATLARYYLHRIQLAQQVKNYPEETFQLMLLQPTVDTEDYLYLRQNADKEIATIKKQVSQILNRAQEVMPVEIVLDAGEPNRTSSFNYQGESYPRYSEGMAIDFVQQYFDVNDTINAEKLGKTLADQNKQAIEYFLNAPTHITLSATNQPFLFSALDAYLQIYSAAINGNDNGPLAKEMQTYIDNLLKENIPSWYRNMESDLNTMSEDKRVKRAVELNYIKDYIQALSADYGLNN